ncbi:hypothetical protein DH2020_048392 [Rehmannia glutinosa]|uniref:Sulfotransferase n=1 Tax=Rehmannia glutinosa TaxID=99300 RepID=A0ABR0U6K4_REHGL
MSIPNLSAASPNPNNSVEKLVNELPKTPFWEARDVYQWEGFWIPSTVIKSAITFRSSFHARNDDIFLASSMKTGTTWLKSLTLCIMQKESHQTHENSHKHDDILTIENPHFHIPTVEATIHSTKDSQIDLYDTSAPHLLHTHLPYAVLPDSVKNSACKISQKRPQKILFIKYEELKSEPKQQVSKIAEFLGRPFADEKEVDEVLWRKGEVGDWKNYLTTEMEEQINQISRIKFEPFGLFL